MGGLCCCCPRSEEFEEYSSRSNRRSICQHCICFQCCWTWFFRTHAVLLEQTEGHDFPSIVQGGSSSVSAGLLVATSSDASSPPDIYHAPPTPFPYDADQRFPEQTRDGREKSGNSHSRSGEVEPLPRTNEDGESALTAMPVDSCIDHGDYEAVKLEISKKVLPSKLTGKVEAKVSPVDDEDVCPTCLDGYNEENPKITTGCGHHFHLSCIYEWMERSIHCPVCYKEMVFSETP
ncbi:hypothetical protein O6H91_01G085900 [Diphasiastrum complanatum]|uniref:Uncharacterized protein n=2 Tax=Diphasiastrum complanatum TaxID=34168 RepID=A0ACC2ET21_DIPCM|nr:hypothetical protein O6H91_01G085900 [Diphasiastrum complanatum]KAJ7569613.1 hypothetical protein O6H91_01G085900 [Diphasiastrum complanatum]